MIVIQSAGNPATLTAGGAPPIFREKKAFFPLSRWPSGRNMMCEKRRLVEDRDLRSLDLRRAAGDDRSGVGLRLQTHAEKGRLRSRREGSSGPDGRVVP